MSGKDEFYTMKGYQRNMEEAEMTSAMEDYLEMIARLYRHSRCVRVGDLSRMLHVKPSSVTKMVRQLGRAGYIEAEKYGDISLTDKGRDAGGYLLYRHDVIRRFLCTLNHTDDELEQAEKIEHFLNRVTVEHLDLLTKRLAKEEGG